MKLNLFDNTFRDDACSVRGATPRQVSYVRDEKEFDGLTLFTDGFIVDSTFREVDSRYKIAWLHEPPGLIPNIYAQVYTESLLGALPFDRVLTYHPMLLEHRNTVYCPYGGVWIEPEQWGLRPKPKFCSMLIGNKKATLGHRMRWQVYEQVKDLGVDFFGAKGTPVDYSAETKRRVHQPYAFSIVCEADYVGGLFTEILLDCFMVGTVPIFWGCPNFEKWFNPGGIIPFDKPDLAAWAVKMCARRPIELYESMLPAIRDNYQRAKEFAVTEDWMYEHILKAYDD